MLFQTEEKEQIARALVEVLYVSNRDNILCGHGADQVYGPAYESLKNLMRLVFGERVTELAMNSRTWCVSDFDNQIVPAIEWAIEEVAQEKRKRKADKLVKLIEDHGHTAQYYEGDGFILAVSGRPEEWKPEEEAHLPVDANKVYEWLGY